MVGEEFAGYRLRSVLGRGGMSVVFETENPRLGSIVALKVLAPELAEDDLFRERFLQESRIAASLNHPNVIPIYDTGPSDGLLYIAMRYVAGRDLRAVLKDKGHISPAQALMLIAQAGRALDAAHRAGLVHRDVKPANILIERGTDDEPDHVYLADFGISKHARSRSGLTATGQLVGTIDYIAPEQIQGKSVDGRADIYSLGCVLYECVTGRVPFKKDLDAAVIWAHVEELPTAPSTVMPELPHGIDDVIARALAKDPDDRYATAHEFVAAARAALEADPRSSASTPLESAGALAAQTVLSGTSAPPSTPPSPAVPEVSEPPSEVTPAAPDPPAPVPPVAARTHETTETSFEPPPPPTAPDRTPDEVAATALSASEATGTGPQPTAAPDRTPEDVAATALSAHEATGTGSQPTAAPDHAPEDVAATALSARTTTGVGSQPAAPPRAPGGEPVVAQAAASSTPPGPPAGPVPPRETHRGRWYTLLLVVLLAAAVAVVVLASGSSTPAGKLSSTALAQVPTNHVTGSGEAMIRLNGNKAAITVTTQGLDSDAELVHLMHIHAGGKGECPPASAARLHNGHLSISTTDGINYYGPAVQSLTVRGDTSPASILAFPRFLSGGNLHYTRTITLPESVVADLRRNNAVVVVHGIDYDGSGIYSGVLDRSELNASLPGTATAPALCGTLIGAQSTAAAGGNSRAGALVYTAALQQNVAINLLGEAFLCGPGEATSTLPEIRREGASGYAA
jgi:serine/threonine protein kinase